MANWNNTKDNMSLIDDPIFIFDKPTALCFKRIKKVDEDNSYYLLMKELVKQDSNIKDAKRYIVVFNKDFDSIIIKNCFKRCYPSLYNCKSFTFIITLNFMKSHLKMIRNYISKISDQTEVSLFIGRLAFTWVKPFSDDFLKLNNIGIFNIILFERICLFKS